LHVEYLDEDTARASLRHAMDAYDEPFGDSSSLATYLLSSVVGRSHKVALGGDGGDEVFAGYKKHRIIGIRDALRRVPGFGSLAAKALRALPARTDRTSAYTDTLRVVRRVSRALSGSDAHAFVSLSQVASMDLTANLVVQPSDPERFEIPLLRLFEHAEGSQLRKTLTGDLDNALPNDMLTKVDRASMACHLEVRVPFLDHRLVELGIGLPSQFTLGGQGKRVLRELHERKFGRALARRKKMGFGVPVERWMRGPLAGECAQVFARERLDRYGVLSSAALGGDGWKRWRDSHPQLLWHAFALAVWCENNLAG
jgi:asparagine synthase (glutamine-hydrolysing)